MSLIWSAVYSLLWTEIAILTVRSISMVFLCILSRRRCEMLFEVFINTFKLRSFHLSRVIFLNTKTATPKIQIEYSLFKTHFRVFK